MFGSGLAPLGRRWEQGLDVAVQGLDLFGEEIVTCVLADEDQELADGFVELAALLGSFLPRDFADRLCGRGRIAVLSSRPSHVRLSSCARQPSRKPVEIGREGGQRGAEAEIRDRVSDVCNLQTNG